MFIDRILYEIQTQCTGTGFWFHKDSNDKGQEEKYMQVEFKINICYYRDNLRPSNSNNNNNYARY